MKEGGVGVVGRGVFNGMGRYRSDGAVIEMMRKLYKRCGSDLIDVGVI